MPLTATITIQGVSVRIKDSHARVLRAVCKYLQRERDSSRAERRKALPGVVQYFRSRG